MSQKSFLHFPCYYYTAVGRSYTASSVFQLVFHTASVVFYMASAVFYTASAVFYTAFDFYTASMCLRKQSSGS